MFNRNIEGDWCGGSCLQPQLQGSKKEYCGLRPTQGKMQGPIWKLTTAKKDEGGIWLKW
jgi:hypothetical protein